MKREKEREWEESRSSKHRATKMTHRLFTIWTHDMILSFKWQTKHCYTTHRHGVKATEQSSVQMATPCLYTWRRTQNSLLKINKANTQQWQPKNKREAIEKRNPNQIRRKKPQKYQTQIQLFFLAPLAAFTLIFPFVSADIWTDKIFLLNILHDISFTCQRA